jgi:hypothetical protein
MKIAAVFVSALCFSAQVLAQAAAVTPLPRLPAEVLPVDPPSLRVSGTPGSMRIVERSCESGVPASELRRRIVDIAAQEWGFFGFQVDDQRGTTPPPRGQGVQLPLRFALLDPAEVARVADSVGGYWAAAPGSDWILERQNESWKGPNGLASRYRDPWSAAFISWVMCESGLGEQAQFRRAIAHHTYIDQAIRAREGREPEAMFVAHDPGEQPIAPGDLLCNGLRPLYRTLAERRAQLGEGARTHCDIVVFVNESAGQILTIGGNVRSSVRMKIFPATRSDTGHLMPQPTARPVFAHLQLKAPAIAPDVLNSSPTLQRLSCTMPATPPTFAIANLLVPTTESC